MGSGDPMSTGRRDWNRPGSGATRTSRADWIGWRGDCSEMVMRFDGIDSEPKMRSEGWIETRAENGTTRVDQFAGQIELERRERDSS